MTRTDPHPLPSPAQVPVLNPDDLLAKLVVSIAAGLPVPRELWETCVRCVNEHADLRNAIESRARTGRRFVRVDAGLHGLLVRVED